MKTALKWQQELNGETSLESIRMIQRDAMLYAASIMKDAAVDYSPVGLVRRFSSNPYLAVIEAMPDIHKE